MRRTRLFHTVVVVGSGLLVGCPRSDHQPAAGSGSAGSGSAAIEVKAPPPVALIDAAGVGAPIDAPVDAPVDAPPPVPVDAKPKPHKQKPSEQAIPSPAIIQY